MAKVFGRQDLSTNDQILKIKFERAIQIVVKMGDTKHIILQELVHILLIYQPNAGFFSLSKLQDKEIGQDLFRIENFR